MCFEIDHGRRGDRGIGVDFVVAGFGVGAILMILGFAVRDLGPLRYRRVEHLTIVHDQWLAMCRSIGTVFVVGGLLVCLATLASLLVGVGDRVGSRLVMAFVAAAVIASGVWSVIAIRQFVALYQEQTDPTSDLMSAATMRRARTRQPRWDASPTLVHDQESMATPDGEIYPGPEEERLVGPVPESFLDEAPDAWDLNGRSVDVAAPLPPDTGARSDDVVGDVQPIEEAPAVEPVEEAKEPGEPAAVAEPDETFTSRLLADVGQEEVEEPAERGFRSALLADLTTGSPPDVGEGRFSSSILADLAPSESIGKRPDDPTASANHPSPPEPSRAEKDSPKQVDETESDGKQPETAAADELIERRPSDSKLEY